MNKRVFVVHGWDGFPEEGWFPWLKSRLEEQGVVVSIPQLPHPENPRIEPWVSILAQTVGTPDDETFFVGHSMGCQTIARYLETLSEGIKVGGAVFVAGFFTRLTHLEDDEEVRETAAHWLETPIDLQKVAQHLPKSVAIFSDDDPYVPLENQNVFRDVLKSEIVIEHGKGHFSGSTGTRELPAAFGALMKLV